jgi:hypothetical protein
MSELKTQRNPSPHDASNGLSKQKEEVSMLKKLRLPALLLATALTLLTPTVALAGRHGREHEHHGRFGVYFGYGPSYGAYGYII